MRINVTSSSAAAAAALWSRDDDKINEHCDLDVSWYHITYTGHIRSHVRIIRLV